MSHNSSPVTFDLHHPSHRRALRTAIAILLATGLVYLLKPPHGEWIILSAFLVSQDTVGSSLWKAKGRFEGAILGAIASLMIYAVIGQYHTLILIAAFLTIFPYAYLVTALNNYHFAFFFLQVAYVCFLAAVGKHPSAGLIEWRAVSIMIGIALGLVVALFVFPTSARPRLQKSQMQAWTAMHHWFDAIVAACQSPTPDRQHLQQLGRTAQRHVLRLEDQLASRKHELIGKPKPGFSWAALRQKDTEFIQAYRPIYQSLLYLNQIIQNSAPADRSTDLSTQTQELIHQLTLAFEQMGQAISKHSLLQLPASSIDSNLPAQDNQEKNLSPNELNLML